MLTVFVLYVKSIYFRAMYVCPSLEAHKLALHIINCKKKSILSYRFKVRIFVIKSYKAEKIHIKMIKR